jgi:hypothetical protein
MRYSYFLLIKTRSLSPNDLRYVKNAQFNTKIAYNDTRFVGFGGFGFRGNALSC